MTHSLQVRKVRPTGIKCLRVFAQVVSRKTRIQNQIFLTPKHMLFTEFVFGVYSVHICRSDMFRGLSSSLSWSSIILVLQCLTPVWQVVSVQYVFVQWVNNCIFITKVIKSQKVKLHFWIGLCSIGAEILLLPSYYVTLGQLIFWLILKIACSTYHFENVILN